MAEYIKESHQGRQYLELTFARTMSPEIFAKKLANIYFDGGYYIASTSNASEVTPANGEFRYSQPITVSLNEEGLLLKIDKKLIKESIEERLNL